MRTTFSVWLLHEVGDAAGQVARAHRHRVQEDLLVGLDTDDGLPLRVGLVGGIRGLRQLDVDALLKHRRDEHHDDQQHEHDVDERRHVDIGLDATFCAANIH